MHCLDLGSGSGILSIAALRLGAESAVGVDIDPKAEDIARENAAYNGFAAPDFTALTGNVTGDRKLMEQLSREAVRPGACEHRGRRDHRPGPGAARNFWERIRSSSVPAF